MTPLSSLLGNTYLSNKGRSDGQRIARYRQWQRREPSRRRAEHHLCVGARIVFGIVTRAFEDGLAVALSLHPFGDGTSRMRADRRIGQDALGRVRPGVVVELSGIELEH